jgi:hypothetical protein
MPGWADATVSFMLSGGYNVAASISKVGIWNAAIMFKLLCLVIDNCYCLSFVNVHKVRAKIHQLSGTFASFI